jgi:anaerobic selenocysteine-containing dehydrogenase
MPSGRARFSVVRIPRIDVPEGRFLLTLRRGKQFNSMTYGDRDPLTGGARRDDVLLDSRDMTELGLHEGDAIVLESDTGEMAAHAKSAPCRRRHVQAFWPEGNVLVGRKYDRDSGEPDYSTTVAIRHAATAGSERR